jgi:hypothetical protein
MFDFTKFDLIDMWEVLLQLERRRAVGYPTLWSLRYTKLNVIIVKAWVLMIFFPIKITGD